MKIVMVTHYYSSHGGGIELAAYHLSSELRNLGHDVKWVATDISEGLPENVGLIPMSGWNVVEDLSGMPYPLWRLCGLRKVYDSIKEADIVHVHEGIYMSSQLCSRLASILKKKVVLTQHVGQIPTKRKWLKALIGIGNASLTRHIMSTSDAVVFVSKVVRDFFQTRNRALVIANGLDPKLFCPSAEPAHKIRARLSVEPERGLVLFVGRFVEKKGLPFVRTLAERFSDVLWVLAGRGPEDPSKWNLPNVKVLGRLEQRELAAWYQSADLLLLPSMGEGFPLVVQEAMGCGLPCAIYRETWAAWGEGGENFIIIDEHRLEQDLNAILLSTRDASFRARVANYAAKSWDWGRAALQYDCLYRSILKAE